MVNYKDRWGRGIDNDTDNNVDGLISAFNENIGCLIITVIRWFLMVGMKWIDLLMLGEMLGLG
ncbi:hypothetical protein [Bathymodiolus thermophilus thioautotrophic gill symbiont]|uniref:Uncharacterized protein n=1 Tax=Bathymodiolus thermophilus thioautotrophic gill symbiont TaxID=2360 RepID=A0A1J5TUM3_9GAMM|nr:hypothetical protein [Bathymodiolus thermophilus thioautotrophic gill symbiont]OIR23868.1 hypothetical protein BGC33_01765 [Bathymodiolus thermophilus thioautotrophic gill symbiont]